MGPLLACLNNVLPRDKKEAPSWQQNQFLSIKQWRDQLYLAHIVEGLPKVALQLAIQCAWIYTTEDSDRTYHTCLVSGWWEKRR
jgi:gamma-glutamylcyclotransferase (GGCT)/AIG2-like uncharacterized protein YtfP